MLIRRILPAVLAIAVLTGGLYLMQRSRAPQDAPVDTGTSTTRQYSSAAYGLSFTYPEAYVLTEMDAPGSGERLHHVITLMRTADLPLPQNGEGPPAITIDIYQNNLDKQETEQWIRNTSASNFKLSEGTLATTTISGQSALSYRWSGLYEGTTIVQARAAWVYAFTVTYLEMGADIIQDFVAIRDSVTIVE